MSRSAQRKTWLCAGLLLAASPAFADATYHSLQGADFQQDWTNTGLLTANDSWTGVPSIIGFRGDATLVEQMLSRHEAHYGRPPRQAALDGGFASKANVQLAKDMGVKDVCFSKRRGIAITDILTKSLGSTNPHNMVRAAFDGLMQLTTVEQIARERGVEPAAIGYRSRHKGKEIVHA